MKHLILAISLMILVGCAGAPPIHYTLPPSVVTQMVDLYVPWKEKGFCVCPVAGVYNVHSGGMFSSPMPICRPGAIVFHSHPIFAERGANAIDWHVWRIYRERYGHDLFGVLLSGGKYKVYKR